MTSYSLSKHLEITKTTIILDQNIVGSFRSRMINTLFHRIVAVTRSSVLRVTNKLLPDKHNQFISGNKFNQATV